MLPSRAGIYIRIADVTEVDKAKSELKEEAELLNEPGKFTEPGGKTPRGTLLVGPPEI